jgi:hypothetical protein
MLANGLPIILNPFQAGQPSSGWHAHRLNNTQRPAALEVIPLRLKQNNIRDDLLHKESDTRAIKSWLLEGDA